MKINSGVEWAAHACALLAVLPEGGALSAEALATYHEVPQAYMAKQMQALRRAGLVHSQRGAVGGYRLAKPPQDITLWNILAAVEGRAPAFRCSEIRQNGPCGASKDACQRPCGIAASFYEAERAFRDSLDTVTLLDVLLDVERQATPEKARQLAGWIEGNANA